MMRFLRSLWSIVCEYRPIDDYLTDSQRRERDYLAIHRL